MKNAYISMNVYWSSCNFFVEIVTFLALCVYYLRLLDSLQNYSTKGDECVILA